MRVLVALTLALALSCRPVPSPSAALLAYAHALRADLPDAAFALLAEDARRRTPLPRFRARWAGLPPEARRREAERLERMANEGQWRESAHATARDRTALLTRTPEGWRLVSPQLDQDGAATPAAAVSAWTTALETRDLARLLELLDAPLRVQLERELGLRLEAYRAASRLVVEGSGDRARLEGPYPLDFVRDDQGLWHVGDVH